MTITISDVLVAIVLFSCVPVQYFLVQKWGFSESSRSYAINRLINHAIQFQEKYLSLSAWKKLVFRLLEKYSFFPTFWEDSKYDDHGESIAVEVMAYKQKEGYFALSPEPRTERSPDIKFRVGQVIVHKVWKYRGVIVGWDETAKAPKKWLDIMHGEEHKNWRNMPNYSILVDTRDKLIPQIGYVPEENIEIVSNTRILHPLIEEYFENFDGVQYIPRPWLKALYPQD